MHKLCTQKKTTTAEAGVFVSFLVSLLARFGVVCSLATTGKGLFPIGNNVQYMCKYEAGHFCIAFDLGPKRTAQEKILRYVAFGFIRIVTEF